mmetsp:Transcript_23494/g.32875  ORF Transcript_23494/g.32875 Transcript_23494/m.32875 type:complete len:81 (-) Transcript_23494:299-541(-)
MVRWLAFNSARIHVLADNPQRIESCGWSEDKKVPKYLSSFRRFSEGNIVRIVDTEKRIFPSAASDRDYHSEMVPIMTMMS